MSIEDFNNVAIGSKFNYLKVISSPFKKKVIYYYKCKCDCGVVKDISCKKLIDNISKCCGCKTKNTRFKYRGVGDLSLAYYNSFKSSRRSKGIIFNDSVTIEFLWELFLNQNKQCKLSGVPLFMNPRWSQQNHGRVKGLYQTASLDRIDSTLGYTKENVQWVHKNINYMKGRISDKEFIEICCLVCQHQTYINSDVLEIFNPEGSTILNGGKNSAYLAKPEK